MISNKPLKCPYCGSVAMIPQKPEIDSEASGYYKCMNNHYFIVRPTAMKHGVKIFCPICGVSASIKLRKMDYEAKGDANKMQVYNELSDTQSKLF